MDTAMTVVIYLSMIGLVAVVISLLVTMLRDARRPPAPRVIARGWKIRGGWWDAHEFDDSWRS